jgi:hypothetical protein
MSPNFVSTGRQTNISERQQLSKIWRHYLYNHRCGDAVFTFLGPNDNNMVLFEEKKEEGKIATDLTPPSWRLVILASGSPPDAAREVAPGLRWLL